jgi:site-specific DNA-cytosine methylase
MQMKQENKRIADLCGGTGGASRYYREAGYDVHIITLPMDIRLTRPFPCYGVVASPPCTQFAGSGARWWEKKGQQALFDGLAIVDACMRFILLAQPKFWMLENPVGRLVHYLGKPKMYFQPYDYGDPWSKKTCLWGNFNTPEKNPVEPTKKDKIWKISPGPCRSRQRSITPPGFARAFFEANQ